jgi:hypothetical protein
MAFGGRIERERLMLGMVQKFLGWFLVSVSGSLLPLATYASPSSGQIAGQVLDDAGNPVTDAIVTANAGTVEASGAKTTSDGGFHLAGLAPGSFRICVQAPGTTLLNPCDWPSLIPTIVNLVDGQSLSLPSIKLQSGYPLQIRVNDAVGAMAANEGKKSGAHLLVGLWLNTGLFMPLSTLTIDPKGRYYGLVIPFATPLQLTLWSKDFVLSSASGQGSGGSFSLTLNVPPGGTVAAPTFSVIGLNSAGGN